MRKFLFVAMMQLIALVSYGQGFLKGKVVDEIGQPLAGANVVIKNSPIGQVTDQNGVFEFSNLTGKEYSLRVSFIGYETVTKAVAVNSSKIVFAMKKSVTMMEEVVVYSTKANDKSPVAHSNVGKETLAKSNLGQDVPYLLNMTPSFVATSDAGTGVGYTGFRIRGTDATRINVTINGIPYNDADEQITFWVDVPDLSSSLDNIQVQRGVGTSTNGAAAFGGNINMQTEKYAPNASGELNVSYGSFNTSKTTAKASSGLLNKHWAIDTRISSISSDGYIDRASVDMQSYYLQAGYYANKTTLKFLTFGGKEKTYHAWYGVPGDSLAKGNRTYNPCGEMGKDANGVMQFYQNQTDNYVQHNYQLLGVHSFSPKLSLNAGLHYTRGDGYYEEYKQDQKLAKYLLFNYVVDGVTYKKTDLVRQKQMYNDFAGGVFSLNYSNDKLSAQWGGALNNYSGEHWGDVIWVKNYVDNLVPIHEYYRNEVSKWDGNTYLKVNYEVLPKLNVYADLQYRRVSYDLTGNNDKWDDAISSMQNLDIHKEFNFFNPKAGVFYRPNKNNEFYASFAIGNREPTRTNYTDAGGSTEPTFETMYDYEAGYQFKNNRFSIGANAYYMNYNNQLILTGKISDIGEFLATNTPESYRLGIEFIAGFKLTDWLKWDGILTLSQNKILNFTENDVDVYDENWEWIGSQNNYLGTTDIAYSPNVITNSMFTFSLKGFEAGLQSSYVGKQYIDNTSDNARSLAAYFVNNLRLGYTLKNRLGVSEIAFSLAVNNMFNEQYSSNGYVWYSCYVDGVRTNDLRYFTQAGTNFIAGVSVKF